MKTLTTAAILLIILFMLCNISIAVAAEEKWTGVDESVVQKIAKEHGRETRTPFINTDQGDMLLFVFLIAGSIGGFVAGYYWRVLMTERSACFAYSRIGRRIRGRLLPENTDNEEAVETEKEKTIG